MKKAKTSQINNFFDLNAAYSTSENSNKTWLLIRLCRVGQFISLSGSLIVALSIYNNKGFLLSDVVGGSILSILLLICTVTNRLNARGHYTLACRILVFTTLVIVIAAYAAFGTALPMMSALLLPITLGIVLLSLAEACLVTIISLFVTLMLYLEQNTLSNYSPLISLDSTDQTLAAATISMIVLPAVAALILLPITERKLAEQALRRSERQYRTVLDNLQEIVFQTDATARFTYLNPAWQQITGFNVSDSLGQDFFHYIHPADRRLNAELFVPLTERKVEWCRHTIRFLTDQGNSRWLELIAGLTLVEEDGMITIAGISGTLSDVTEKRQTESLEKDRSQILEMIASDRPLAQTLRSICLMVERQYAGVSCAIQLKEATVENQTGVVMPFVGGRSNLERSLVVSKNPNFSPINGELEPPLMTVSLISNQEVVLGFLTARFRLLTNGDIGLQRNKPMSEVLKDLLEIARQLATIAIEQEQLSKRLLYQAHHDALTGLPNRTLFESHLQQLIKQQPGKIRAILFIDLDRFKLINDTLGHRLGDVLLQQVAARLVSCVRTTDMVARRGGDEFTVLLSDVTRPEDAPLVARKCLRVLEAPFLLEEHELFVTASIGLSFYPQDGDSVAELERKADSAMYLAKEQGRNNVQSFDETLNQFSSQRLKLQTELRRALERAELRLFYQPQLEINNRTLRGVEALVRWQHPQRGLVSPTEFIPMAEENGLIIAIGEWVLNEACQQLKSWQNRGYALERVAVNVSALQFEQANFVETIMRILKQNDLEADRLELEVSESLLLRDIQHTALKLNQLRNLGVKVALDDFGTGYSSLSYLQQLPIDILKIDQTFIRKIDGDIANHPSSESPKPYPLEGSNHLPSSTNGAITQAIITLAHSLGMRVVAEGVETVAQLSLLEQAGCEALQGYLFSHPLPPVELEELLDRYSNVLWQASNFRDRKTTGGLPKQLRQAAAIVVNDAWWLI